MGPYFSITDRIALVGRLILPYSVIFALFILNVISAPHPLSLLFKAPFFLMAIYYWTIFRPTLVPSWFVFICGLLLDILSGLPLGFNAVIYVICRMVIFDQRRFLMSQSFMMTWLGFAILNVSYHGIQWLLFSLMHWHLISFHDLWPPIVLGVLFYPAASVILHLTHKVLPVPLAQTAGSFNSQRKGIPL